MVEFAPWMLEGMAGAGISAPGAGLTGATIPATVPMAGGGFDMGKAMMLANALGVRPESFFAPPDSPRLGQPRGMVANPGRPERAINYRQLLEGLHPRVPMGTPAGGGGGRGF